MERAAGKPPAGGPATDEQKMTPDGGTATDETKTPDCCAATEGPPNGECPDASDERALDAGEPPVNLRQRGSDELVMGALCRMGFQVRQARRALRIVGERRARTPTDAIATLLREAVAVLAT